MLDHVAGVRPLVRILVAKFDEIRIDSPAIHEKAGEPASADFGVVTDEDPVSEHFAADALGSTKGRYLRCR